MKLDDFRYYIECTQTSCELFKVHNKERVTFWAEHKEAQEIDKIVYLALLKVVKK